MKKPMLLGIPFDNGIRMMQRFGRGVTGAAETPQLIFDRLEKLDIEKRMLDLRAFQFEVTAQSRDDPLSVARDNALTLAGHAAIAREAGTLWHRGFFPIAVGGDHSITYPLMRAASAVHTEKRFGLIYIDAHLDLRPLESHAGVAGLVSSGNTFRRILEDRELPVEGRNMAIIGMHRSPGPIFQEMERCARQNGMTVIEDRECTLENVPALAGRAVAAAAGGTDGIYLSLDIDAVNRKEAPAVSAPAEQGLNRSVWLAVVREIAEKADLVGLDLVEASTRRQGWRHPFEGAPDASPSAGAALARTLELAAETIHTFLAVLRKQWYQKP